MPPDPFLESILQFLAHALAEVKFRQRTADPEQIWSLADGGLEAHLIVAPSTWRPSRGLPLVSPGALGGAPTGTLPPDLNAIELATYQAATDSPQSLKTLARKTGYSHGRVREAVARLTLRNPPLLMRTSQGIRRMPRS